MIPTNLTHKITPSNPIVYNVYFLQNVSDEIERIASKNFCDDTIRPYNWWLNNFYATVQWVREVNQWLSLLTYGHIAGSLLQPNGQYQHTNGLGTLTYQRVRDIDNTIKIIVTSINFTPYTFKTTTILMETKIMKIKESQLRRIIAESIKRVITEGQAYKVIDDNDFYWNSDDEKKGKNPQKSLLTLTDGYGKTVVVEVDDCYVAYQLVGDEKGKYRYEPQDHLYPELFNAMKKHLPNLPIH